MSFVKKESQNVKVVVRIRPLSKKELESNAHHGVKCLSETEISVKDKRFSYDKVFPPASTQLDIYSAVMGPMIPDVIAGYNCTVFAYGQTGSGKTYTMTGGDPENQISWREDDVAGCIPRAAVNIFDEIEKLGNVDFTVRVSYLELYNEEVRDLLIDGYAPPLVIYSDPNNKGTVHIQGLREVTVNDRDDIHNLLEKGAERRVTANTLMNNQSSRSHTVFTITVNFRQVSISGETVIRMGKLNVVDLAGSENINKSGAKDARFKELANINRSLLTLGRVIQTLAEKKQQHVPYRESKLTRILQDSLGGTTKTCIIATISPASNAFEETISTLEYARRAREITNCPQVNKKINVSEMLQTLTDEYHRMKKDLDAARAADGFYVDQENYQEMINDLEVYKEEASLKNHKLNDLVKSMNTLEHYRILKLNQHQELIKSAELTQKALEDTNKEIQHTDSTLEKVQQVSSVLEQREAALIEETTSLYKESKEHSKVEEILVEKVDNLYNISHRNEETATTNSNYLLERLDLLEFDLNNFDKESGSRLKQIREICSDLKKYINCTLSKCDEINKIPVKCKDIGKTDENSYANQLKRKIENRVSLVEKNNVLDKIEKSTSKKLKEAYHNFITEMKNVANNMMQNMENIRETYIPEVRKMAKTKEEYKDILTTAIEEMKMENEEMREDIDERTHQLIPSFAQAVLEDYERNEEFIKDLEIDVLQINCDLDAIFKTVHQQVLDSQKFMLRNIEELVKKYMEEKENSFIQHNNELKPVFDNLKVYTDNFAKRFITSLYSLDDLDQEHAKKIESMKSVNNVCCEKLKLTMEILEQMDGCTYENLLEFFLSEIRYLLEQANYIVREDSRQKLIPVCHEGDTPDRQELPRPSDIAHIIRKKEDLYKKFMECYIDDEEKENIEQ